VAVAVGSELTLLGHEPAHASHVHGDDGLGGVVRPATSDAVGDEHAVPMITRVTRERPGEVHLLATGPLTNVALALALALDPGLVDRVASVTIMGGAVHAPGNVTSRAEANIHKDPEAARRVLLAPWPVTLVPLDATMGEILTEDHRRALPCSARARRSGSSPRGSSTTTSTSTSRSTAAAPRRATTRWPRRSRSGTCDRPAR
jgi:purine nucleosidase